MKKRKTITPSEPNSGKTNIDPLRFIPNKPQVLKQIHSVKLGSVIYTIQYEAVAIPLRRRRHKKTDSFLNFIRLKSVKGGKRNYIFKLTSENLRIVAQQYFAATESTFMKILVNGFVKSEFDHRYPNPQPIAFHYIDHVSGYVKNKSADVRDDMFLYFTIKSGGGGSKTNKTNNQSQNYNVKIRFVSMLEFFELRKLGDTEFMKIFEFMQLRDIFKSVSLSCKKLYHLCCNNQSMWKHYIDNHFQSGMRFTDKDFRKHFFLLWNKNINWRSFENQNKYFFFGKEGKRPYAISRQKPKEQGRYRRFASSLNKYVTCYLDQSDICANLGIYRREDNPNKLLDKVEGIYKWRFNWFNRCGDSKTCENIIFGTIFYNQNISKVSYIGSGANSLSSYAIQSFGFSLKSKPLAGEERNIFLNDVTINDKENDIELFVFVGKKERSQEEEKNSPQKDERDCLMFIRVNRKLSCCCFMDLKITTVKKFRVGISVEGEKQKISLVSFSFSQRKLVFNQKFYDEKINYFQNSRQRLGFQLTFKKFAYANNLLTINHGGKAVEVTRGKALGSFRGGSYPLVFVRQTMHNKGKFEYTFKIRRNNRYSKNLGYIGVLPFRIAYDISNLSIVAKNQSKYFITLSSRENPQSLRFDRPMQEVHLKSENDIVFGVGLKQSTSTIKVIMKYKDRGNGDVEILVDDKVEFQSVNFLRFVRSVVVVFVFCDDTLKEITYEKFRFVE